MATEPSRRLFTVDDYERMAEVGILRPEDRVELLDGEVVLMAAIGSRHAAATRRLTRLLSNSIGERASIGVQVPVILDDFSQPEPDVSLCIPRDDEYETGHPRPRDIFLLIEVADTSLRYDRERKLLRYAAVGIPETWLVDLTRNTIEVHRAPGPSGYADRTVHTTSDTLTPTVFPDVTIAVADVIH